MMTMCVLDNPRWWIDGPGYTNIHRDTSDRVWGWFGCWTLVDNFRGIRAKYYVIDGHSNTGTWQDSSQQGRDSKTATEMRRERRKKKGGGDEVTVTVDCVWMRLIKIQKPPQTEYKTKSGKKINQRAKTKMNEQQKLKRWKEFGY